eukprot:2903199-Rhodomonas_salina.3
MSHGLSGSGSCAQGGTARAGLNQHTSSSCGLMRSERRRGLLRPATEIAPARQSLRHAHVTSLSQRASLKPAAQNSTVACTLSALRLAGAIRRHGRTLIRSPRSTG